MTKAVPDDIPALTPMLDVKDAAAAIDWYVETLDAVEEGRLTTPDGSIAYASVLVGGTPIAVADENPDFDNSAPPSLGGSPVRLHLYVEDVDAVFERALAAGAVEKFPVEDQFYGDRSSRFEDPFGHVWVVASHREDVPLEEMQERMDAMFGGE